MKELFSIFLLFCLLGCDGVSDEEKSNAIEYNDNLVSLTDEATKSLNHFLDVTIQNIGYQTQGGLTTEQKIEYELAFQKLHLHIKLGLEEVKNIDEFDDEIRLKNEADIYLNNCLSIVKNEFQSISILLKNRLDYKNSIDIMEHTLSAWRKLIDLEKRAKNAQIDFADKYDFDLPNEKQNWIIIEIEYVKALAFLESLKEKSIDEDELNGDRLYEKVNSKFDSLFHDSIYNLELKSALENSVIDDYYKNIFHQERIIPSDDSKMLSITDSLFTTNPQTELFYFIVFTKSMNGSDGFYSEAVGLAAYDFINAKTKSFAKYFNSSPNLNQRDMDNWASYIYGEILISKEGEVLEAIEELEASLISSIEDEPDALKMVIEKLISKIERRHYKG